MTRKSFISSLFLAPLAAVVGKKLPKPQLFGMLADGILTEAKCVPCGEPCRDGDEIWGKNLGYQPGDTFMYDGKRWIVTEVATTSGSGMMVKWL